VQVRDHRPGRTNGGVRAQRRDHPGDYRTGGIGSGNVRIATSGEFAGDDGPGGVQEEAFGLGRAAIDADAEVHRPASRPQASCLESRGR
jgi:hypothetical protein